MCDYIVCGKCGYCYDPVEMRGGICCDCREEQERKERAEEAFAGFSEQADGQMSFVHISEQYTSRVEKRRA